MKKIFSKNKIYSENQISEIATANNLVTVDCLKDENMISLEEFIGGELSGECLFEFDRIGENKFLMRWAEFEN